MKKKSRQHQLTNRIQGDKVNAAVQRVAKEADPRTWKRKVGSTNWQTRALKEWNGHWTVARAFDQKTVRKRFHEILYVFMVYKLTVSFRAIRVSPSKFQCWTNRRTDPPRPAGQPHSPFVPRRQKWRRKKILAVNSNGEARLNPSARCIVEVNSATQ